MKNQLNLFYYCIFVALICVSNGSTNVSNNKESVKSPNKLLKSRDAQFNTTSLKDVMLHDDPGCDCGPNSEDCWWNNAPGDGQKCKCNKGYAPKLRVKDEFCEECNCSENGLACNFDSQSGRQNCTCAKGYGQKLLNIITGEQTCEECDCGTNGVECLKFPDNKKLCYCRHGRYRHFFLTTTDEKCKECDCGPDSISCDFNSDKTQFCKCKPGYSSEKESDYSDEEYCKRCDCGEHGKCHVRDVGRRSVKQCSCKPGYLEYKGKCKKCDCGSNSLRCTLSEDNGNQRCVCPKGYKTKETYLWKDEFCEKCDCGEFGDTCKFMFRLKRCTCKEGYTSEYGITTDDGICEETWVTNGWIALIAVAVILVIVVVGGAVIIKFIFISKKSKR